MKTKKKENNSFRFQNFAERISNIKITVFSQTAEKFDGIPENDKDTFFCETLEKLREINCSLDFISLYRELKPYVQSYKLLLFHKEKIVTLLRQYLSLEGSFAITACLDLLGALSRDLSNEFYPIFEEVFSALIQLLKRKDAKLIEDTFVCLACIFKCTWRYMVNDICNLFRNFKCLLSSSQEHIQFFATESLAFLVQKSKQKKTFIHHLFNEVCNEPDLAVGIGRLIFQTIKGIKNQFILSANEILSICLMLFQCNSFDNDQVYIVLEATWTFSIKHASPEYSGLLFDTIYGVIEQLPSACSNTDDTFSYYIKLLNVGVNYKGGCYIPDQSILFKVLEKYFSSVILTYEDIRCLTILLKSSMLISHIKVTDSKLHKIFETFLSHENIELLDKLSFCRSMFHWNKFELVLKKPILGFASKCLVCKEKENYCEVKNAILQFIVDLIYKDVKLDEPFCIDVDKSLIQFPVSNSDQITIEDMLLAELDTLLWASDVQWIWIIVTCLCYCKLVDERKVISIVSRNTIYGLLACNEKTKDDSLFTLAHCIKAILILERSDISGILPVENMLQLIRNFPSNEHILQCFEAYCCSMGRSVELFAKENATKLYQVLKVNISSPYKLVCLLTLRIFQHLDFNGTSDGKVKGVFFQYCIDAITIEVSINSYQERLVIMRKLRWNDEMIPLYEDAALRFFVGNLFLNFSLIWEHLYVLIASYALGSKKVFWEIWKEVLDMANEKCAFASSKLPCDNIVSSHGTFFKYFTAISVTKEHLRIDYNNFRLLLWNAMTKFPGLVEKNVKDIIPLFLSFMRDEYCLIDEMIAQQQDLSIKLAVDDVNKESKKVTGKGKKEFKALCAHLKVFSTFKNPRAIGEEFQFYQRYLDFLTSKDNEIQSLAISCLMTYQLPFMVPYKENFDMLMNDSKFRDELMFFTTPATDDKNEGIQADHLEKLLPIIIRLLYGKLQRRSGLGISGKSSSYARRNIIIEFLTNCSSKEIQPFFNLILEPFKLFNDKTFCNSSVDITCIVPLRKQTGFLNMFTNIMTKLSNKVNPYLPQMFTIILKLLWNSSQYLKLKDQIHPSYIARLKEIRRLGHAKLNALFEMQTDFHFEDYVEEIFTYAVWPQLTQMITDSTQCVTPLLKLFVTWSKNIQYHSFLSVPDKDGETPLSCLFQVLKQKSLTADVEKLIMVVAFNLLSMEHLEENRNNGLIPDMLGTNVCKSVGIQLIKPFVTDILKHICANLVSKTKENSVGKRQMMKNIIPSIQFSVLSHISEFVTDTDQCSLIISILFPLLQYIASEDTQVYILKTIRNLLPCLATSGSYLNIVPSLFSMVHARKPRQLLCEVYVNMTKDDESLKNISLLIDCLNSWDKSRLDEPDYERRLGAFRDINEQVKSNKWNCQRIIPILHNCLYFVLSTGDMSLRNAASSCIENIVYLVTLNLEDLFTDVVLKTLFPVIKRGLKSKEDEVRSEFLNMLGLLVKTFHHKNLMDMSCLCSDDPETDFFKNFNHIQVHRRIRAIRQLSTYCGEGKISASNMFFIILPMISSIIFSKLAVSKDHNLLSETISAIGCIMKNMPWAKYVHVLRNYLKVLRKDKRNQKNILRVLMVILNNFHFDLSLLDVKNECLQMRLDDNTDKDIETNLQSEESKIMADKPKEETKEDVQLCLMKRIYLALNDDLIPQLNRFLKKKACLVKFGKSNYEEMDDEEILKLPMELALVQLLQLLPTASLHLNLPGILLRVSQSLKNHSKEVRDIARDTIKKISFSLGASYLPMVIKEMRSVLHQGYQLHVLGFTLHSILDNMVNVLKIGDLDDCLQNVMEIVVNELIGTVAEEKDVSAITNKLYEAKHQKSYEILEILGKYVSNECIGKVIGPLKEVLDSAQNKTTIHKLEEGFLRISNGLQSNEAFTDEDILIFIHGVISDALPYMGNKENESKECNITQNTKSELIKYTYLVAEKPTRGGVASLLSNKVNNHVLIEFGLLVLHGCLKRQRFGQSDMKHVKMLDPIIPLILKNITSSYNKITTLSIKCLSFLLKFPLPAVKSNSSTFGKNLFRIIKTCSQGGTAKGQNAELISCSFKAMTLLIRDYKDFIATEKQLHILLSLVEEDLHASSRHFAALPLLKAILSRKMKVVHVHKIIMKISDLSIRDSDAMVRVQCRKIMLQYLLDYPLGKKIVGHFDFYISHLSYEEEAGRISALEMLTLIFNNFHECIILEYAGYIFIPLVMMLVNDDSATCRRMCGCAIKILILKIDLNTRDDLFNIVTKLSADDKTSLQHVSIQLIGLFVEVEKKNFNRRVESILPLLIEKVQTYVKTNDSDDNKAMDKLLYNTLLCLVKFFTESESLLTNDKHMKQLRHTCDVCKEHLLHPHAWIRLAASQLFSLFFASFTPDDWVKKFIPSDETHLMLEFNLYVKDLCFLFLAQLKDNQLSKEIADQATKNLVFLTRVIKLLDPSTNVQTNINDEIATADENKTPQEKYLTEEKPITVKTIIKRLCQLAAYESSHNPKETLKRVCIFRLIASLSLCLGELYLEDYLVDLLRPIHREISSSSSEDSAVHILAQEVLELIRDVVKKEIFANAYSKLQKNILDIKAFKKRKLMTEAVADPSQFALRKRKRNLAKRDQRKRKLCEQKPFLKLKKIRSCIESE